MNVAVLCGTLSRDPEARVLEFTLFEWIPSGEFTVHFGVLAGHAPFMATLREGRVIEDATVNEFFVNIGLDT